MEKLTKLQNAWARVQQIKPARILIPLILTGVIFISRYLYSSSYGLYEDDYSRISPAMGMNLPELGEQLKFLFTQYVGQGRPLQLAFTFTKAYAGWNTAGMVGIYLIGLFVLSLNAVLFYFLLKRISNPTFAFLGGLIFCLYSADTNQTYLTRALGVFPSLTFFMLAVHLYLHNRKVLAYILSFFILLTYETPFPLLYAMPLLTFKWDRKTLKALIVNAAVLTGILSTVFLIRFLLGEGRVTGLNLSDALIASISHMAIGPIVNLGTFFLRPFQAIQGLQLSSMIAIAVSFFFFLIILTRLDFDDEIWKSPDQNWSHSVDWMVQMKGRAGRFLPKLTGPFLDVLPLITVGFLFLVLGYTLTFTVRPYAISGRETRVHFAGIIGSSFIWTAILYKAKNWLDTKIHSVFSATIIAFLFSLTIGFGFIVQRDYQQSWRLQKEFWGQLVELVPDISKGTVILVDPEGLEDGKYIRANNWNLPMMLEQVFVFPSEWEFYDIPRVYRLTPDWERYILGEGGLFHLNARTTIASRSYDRAVDPRNVILVTTGGGTIERFQGNLQFEGRSVELKPIRGSNQKYQEGVLFDLLIESNGQ
jgi:hypothetical protein